MNSIPKVIHYCWFGGNPLSKSTLKCIESWKKYCPDYEIIQWNEKNFDINSNVYVKEACDSKKWAFITDYVRLFALHEYGGVYMDTDVEVIKNIDGLLHHKAFSGFELVNTIPTAIMAAQKGNDWIGMLLSYYNDRHFIKEDGSLDTTTNVVTITNMTKENYNITLDNTLQQTNGDVTFYPKDYFCPKDYQTGEITLTENTYSIHHFSGSWQTKGEKLQHEVQKRCVGIFGDKLGDKVFEFYMRLNRLSIRVINYFKK